MKFSAFAILPSRRGVASKKEYTARETYLALFPENNFPVKR